MDVPKDYGFTIHHNNVATSQNNGHQSSKSRTSTCGAGQAAVNNDQIAFQCKDPNDARKMAL
jgi:hypothetical protein